MLGIYLFSLLSKLSFGYEKYKISSLLNDLLANLLLFLGSGLAKLEGLFFYKS
jgi:hypothetical protein